MYISRYKDVYVNGELKTLPFIDIPISSEDKYENYVPNLTRFDKLALKYYGDSSLGYLISMANPERTYEFDFEMNDQIRIPLPKDKVVSFYFDALNFYLSL